MGLGANWRAELLGDPEAFAWAREAAEARLAALAVKKRRPGPAGI